MIKNFWLENEYKNFLNFLNRKLTKFSRLFVNYHYQLKNHIRLFKRRQIVDFFEIENSAGRAFLITFHLQKIFKVFKMSQNETQ